MTTSRRMRTALLAATTAALLGSLGFLFVKSNAAEHKTEAQALALLRELGELSQRWDADALRLTSTLAPVVPTVPDRSQILSRIFNEMEHGAASDALALNADTLRAGMEEKQAAYHTLQQRHARSLQTIDVFRDRLATLGAEIAAVRARESGITTQAAALLASVERLRAAITVTDIEAHAELSQLLEPPLATLPAAAGATHASLRPAALRAQAAGEEYLSGRESEANAWRRFTFLTVARASACSRATWTTRCSPGFPRRNAGASISRLMPPRCWSRSSGSSAGCSPRSARSRTPTASSRTASSSVRATFRTRSSSSRNPKRNWCKARRCPRWASWWRASRTK